MTQVQNRCCRLNYTRASSGQLWTISWVGAIAESHPTGLDCHLDCRLGRMMDSRGGVVGPGDSALRSLVDSSSAAVLGGTHVEPAETMRQERTRASVDSGALAAFMNGGQAKLDRK